MLQLDSLVLDLIFSATAELDPQTLVDALGGPELLRTRKVLDPDMQDPRFELEMSPSMPFRRQNERRLMVIDDSVAPMRKDPQADPVVRLDLRPEKERLIKACERLDVRVGRLFALGSWGDAVLVARDARDLRGIALIAWALDPNAGLDGKRRANRLSQAEFEEKLMAFDKRLEELDEQQILGDLGAASFERRGDLIVVDVLDNDGTWDLRKSLQLEQKLAAIDRFSLFPGAPSTAREPAAPPRPAAAPSPAAAPPPAAAAAPPPVDDGKPSAPLGIAELDAKTMLIFPRDRFDLDIAAAIGKRDWGAVLRSGDPLASAQRDRIQREGAGFIAPLEFLSEVFVDGKPLSRSELDQKAQRLDERARALEVHCPRFGPVMLFDIEGRGRFITSELSNPARVLPLLP